MTVYVGSDLEVDGNVTARNIGTGQGIGSYRLLPYVTGISASAYRSITYSSSKSTARISVGGFGRGAMLLGDLQLFPGEKCMGTSDIGGLVSYTSDSDRYTLTLDFAEMATEAVSLINISCPDLTEADIKIVAKYVRSAAPYSLSTKTFTGHIVDGEIVLNAVSGSEAAVCGLGNSTSSSARVWGVDGVYITPYTGP